MFTARDQELLTFVAHHIGSSLERKRAQERLKVAHAELESRVESRTSELARPTASCARRSANASAPNTGSPTRPATTT